MQQMQHDARTSDDTHSGRPQTRAAAARTAALAARAFGFAQCQSPSPTTHASRPRVMIAAPSALTSHQNTSKSVSEDRRSQNEIEIQPQRSNAPTSADSAVSEPRLRLKVT